MSETQNTQNETVKNTQEKPYEKYVEQILREDGYVDGAIRTNIKTAECEYFKIKDGFGEYGPLILMGFKTPQGVEIPRLKLLNNKH